MADIDLVIRAPRVITKAGEVSRCVAVRDGVVVAIEPLEAELEGEETVELADDEVLIPGLVDSHVHVNEPGRTEWEGYETATRAAVAGGVTTIIDMPLNSIPPTCTVEALEVKREAARGKCHVDVGFWGGAIPANIDDLRGLHDAGVFGFKCFMVHSGVDEFPPLSAEQLEEYLRVLASYGAKMIVHVRTRSRSRAPAPHGRRYADFLASRPRGSENLAIAHLIEAARHTGAFVHLLHLSSSDAVPMIRTARREGIQMTVETCPHYLTFEAESIPDGSPASSSAARRSGRRTKREELWARVGPRRRRLHCLRPLPVHARAQAARPRRVRPGVGRDLVAAARAVRRVERGSAAGLHARRRCRWMAERPAYIARLQHKGQIDRGYHADFAVFAPDDAFIVDPHRLHHRNPVTPYAYRPLGGVVRSTWLRGRRVTGDEPLGQMISRGEA